MVEEWKQSATAKLLEKEDDLRKEWEVLEAQIRRHRARQEEIAIERRVYAQLAQEWGISSPGEKVSPISVEQAGRSEDASPRTGSPRYLGNEPHLTKIQVMAHILQEAEHPLSVQEIERELRRRGRPTSRANVSSTLSRRPEFVQVDAVHHLWDLATGLGQDHAGEESVGGVGTPQLEQNLQESIFDADP